MMLNKNNLKTVLLTTDTIHHRYYSAIINELYPWDSIFIEEKVVLPPFKTRHPFEEEQRDYELKELLNGNEISFEEISETFCYKSLNLDEAISTIRSRNPDVILVFGTGRICSKVIDLANIACLNLHGGNPECYRGLDSHLWAIYHRDFDNLITTLHYMDEHLDTGDIIFQTQLPLYRNAKMYQLRSINTKICVNLTNLAICALINNITLPRRKQETKGRYYSFMPEALKEECLKKFQAYTTGL